MSRYILQIKDNQRVFIGWDNPLQTFFAQTFTDFDTPNEELVWCIGETYGAIPTPVLFVQKLEREGFEVPYDMYEFLITDYANRTELTPLQKNMKSFFENFKY
jgi:hypothetical protein